MPFKKLERVEIDTAVRELCVKSYHNHKNGCPNFNKKAGCPPQAPFIRQSLDFDHTTPRYAIWNCFDFAGHVARMKELHPKWTECQARCCLYWQQRARKALREEIEFFLWGHPGLKVILCPEAQGVDVTATMKGIGIHLEWPPESVAYQVAIAGTAAK